MDHFWNSYFNEFFHHFFRAEFQKLYNRIIFAKRLPHEKHLARIKNADLFLDTIPYNAHTTASDALWGEVPVLTLSGKSFASRVGSSILTAVGLTELIAPNIKKYESIALNLAKSPNKLSSLKQKLRKNFSTKPLFNTKLYTKNLENKYEKIWKDHQKKLSSDANIS